MRVAWLFFDPVTSASYSWEVNPNESDSPSNSKQIFYSASTAPNGNVIMMEGRDEPKKITFSGVILEETQYYELINWFNKRNPIRLTDDLGRVMTIYITSFNPKRVRSRSFPWRHTYTVEATVLA